jgi:hypothetical protein
LRGKTQGDWMGSTGLNWDFDSERFQDEPWKMSKYDLVLNTIIINDNHSYWHNIRNLTDETLKFRLKWDYIVALTLKEIILFDLQKNQILLLLNSIIIWNLIFNF